MILSGPRGSMGHAAARAKPIEKWKAGMARGEGRGGLGGIKYRVPVFLETLAADFWTIRK